MNPTQCVVDTSVALAWVLDDERDPASVALLESIGRGETAWVPVLWKLEVANVLVVAARRKRVSYDLIPELLRALESLGIREDLETGDRAWDHSLALSIEHGLSLYDATYLELAERLGVPLATKNKAMERAAAKCGIRLRLSPLGVEEPESSITVKPGGRRERPRFAASSRRRKGIQ